MYTEVVERFPSLTTTVKSFCSEPNFRGIRGHPIHIFEMWTKNIFCNKESASNLRSRIIQQAALTGNQLCIIRSPRASASPPAPNRVHLPNIRANSPVKKHRRPKASVYFHGFQVQRHIFLFSSSKFTLPNYKWTGAFKRNSDELTRSLFIEQSSGNILFSKLQIFSSSGGMDKVLQSHVL